jgi:uncharacterized protein HemY
LNPADASGARIASWAATYRPTEWIAKSRQALAKRDLSAARAALDVAKRSAPEDPDVLMLEARVVEAEGPAAAAEVLYRKAANALAAAIETRPNGRHAVALAKDGGGSVGVGGGGATWGASSRHSSRRVFDRVCAQ